FEVIDLPVLEGDAKAAMTNPGSLVLSEKMAKQLFGSQPALGKAIKVNDKDEMHVAAIVADARSNTRFQIDILASIASPAFAFPPQMSSNWGNVVQETYVRFRDPARVPTIASQMPDFVARHAPPGNFKVTLALRSLRETHLVESPDAKISNRNIVAI